MEIIGLAVLMWEVREGGCQECKTFLALTTERIMYRSLRRSDMKGRIITLVLDLLTLKNFL